MNIPKEFKNITGFDLLSRRINQLSEGIERKDSLFPQLAILYFSNRKRFKKLRQKIRNWLRKEQSETIFALAGYIYYINEDFKKARGYFLKTISLNPDNLDNWLDLAFVLRHIGDTKISEGILFHFDYVIYYYKYLKLFNCDYKTLRNLILKIVKNAP